MGEEMAIMKDVKFGVRDVGKANLSFTVHRSSGTASLQILYLKEAVKLIEKHQIKDINELEGHACIIETKKPPQFPLGVSTFVDLFVP